jgi:hypothetical protein
VQREPERAPHVLRGTKWKIPEDPKKQSREEIPTREKKRKKQDGRRKRNGRRKPNSPHMRRRPGGPAGVPR